MGPRLFSRGNLKKRWSTVGGYILQWGRDSSVAEIAWRRQVDGLDASSMGPRLFSRGNLGSMMLCAFLSGLQWGRDSSVAEMSQSTPYDRTDRRSSMGPRLFSRGNLAAYEQLQRQLASSMGPRLFSRGNVVIRLVSMPESSLQWGRDSSVAEISLAGCMLPL